MNRLAWVMCAAVPAAVVGWLAWPRTAAPAVAGIPVAGEKAGGRHPSTPDFPLGQGSCAAAGCHGGPASETLRKGPSSGCWTCSATYWAACDPHTKAYAALTSELATRIMVRLTGERAPGRPTIEAAQDTRCLACHTDPALAPATVPGLAAGRLLTLRAEGVSCEACHGSPGRWLHEHTTWTAATRVERYAQTGMARLYDLGERATVCAGCHVGAPKDSARGYPVRDMNHDMIAAGHPRLNFDFADYQRSLPPHWHERDRIHPVPPSGDLNFEAKAWLVGRVAHAEAACRLLADRASRSRHEGDCPWPEFGEFGCASCHHTINGESGLPFPAPRTGRLGVPRWQPVWPVTRPDDVNRLAGFGLAPAQSKAVAAAITALKEKVQKPRPSPQEVVTLGGDAARALQALRVELVQTPGSQVRFAVTGLMAAVAAQNRVPELDRDEAGQLLHGLAAIERTRVESALKAGRQLPAPEPFDRVFDRLRLPRGTLRFDVPRQAQQDLTTLLGSVR